MSLQFVEESPWLRVEEVMKHEMAHQYVSDVLGIEGEETAHGPAFRMVCDRYGIDGGTTLRRSEEEQAIVEKARKLLRLSESPNVHEAEAALAALQRLLGRNGLSEADIREREGEDFGVVVLGEAHPRLDLHVSYLGMLLADHFHVRFIRNCTFDPRLRKAVQQLEIVGKRSDLVLAEYVHDWLLRTAESCVPSGLSKRDRLDFLAGVVKGFSKKLDEERREQGVGADDRAALVKLGIKIDADLDAFFKRRFPRITMSRRGRRLGSEYHAGQQVGRGLNMSKPMGSSGPKLLGPPR